MRAKNCMFHLSVAASQIHCSPHVKCKSAQLESSSDAKCKSTSFLSRRITSFHWVTAVSPPFPAYFICRMPVARRVKERMAKNAYLDRTSSNSDVQYIVTLYHERLCDWTHRRNLLQWFLDLIATSQFPE